MSLFVSTGRGASRRLAKERSFNRGHHVHRRRSFSLRILSMVFSRRASITRARNWRCGPPDVHASPKPSHSRPPSSHEYSSWILMWRESLGSVARVHLFGPNRVGVGSFVRCVLEKRVYLRGWGCAEEQWADQARTLVRPRHVDGMAAPRMLFGGAMSTVLPARLGDVSDVRPVPDHQEVFADPERDQSVIVELLEAQDATNEQALQVFFQDLVELNGGTQARVEHVEKLQSVPNLPEAGYTGVLEGHMVAAKHNEGPAAANRVHLLLALVRLPRAKTDVLITLNTPLEISMNSSSAAATNGHLPTADTAVEEARRIVVQAIDTLQVSDWGLFGP